MENLVQFFKAMADKTRLEILALLLWEEELCVCDIENVLDLSQSKTSRHLRYLLNSGLLKDKRKNVWVYYSLDTNLNKEEQVILSSFKNLINDESWTPLKLKLTKWIKRKEKLDSCKAF